MSEQKNEVILKIEGKSYKPYLFVLVTILSTLMQVLSSTGNNTTQAIVTLYFSIILLTISIYEIGFWGVAAAGLSSLFFLLVIQHTLTTVVFVLSANILQALLIYLAFRVFSFTEEANSLIRKETLWGIIAGGVYMLYNVLSHNHYFAFSGMILAFLILIYVTEGIRYKRKEVLQFLVFVVLIPNCAGAALGAFQDGYSLLTPIYCGNMLRWLFSNTILMLSFGYPLFLLVKKKKIANKDEGYLTVKLSTLLFYISTILWNVIIFGLFYLGWLNKNTNIFIFPWFVGNLFFIANLFFSIYPEIDENETDRFQWYENRSVVAENNTQMLVAIISFLLPICAQLLGTITYSISVLFIFNITCAIISIGLIWIPKNYIHYMSTIKHFKTVFHLFTLSLLLLNIVLIIDETVIH